MLMPDKEPSSLVFSIFLLKISATIMYNNGESGKH